MWTNIYIQQSSSELRKVLVIWKSSQDLLTLCFSRKKTCTLESGYHSQNRSWLPKDDKVSDMMLLSFSLIIFICGSVMVTPMASEYLCLFVKRVLQTCSMKCCMWDSYSVCMLVSLIIMLFWQWKWIITKTLLIFPTLSYSLWKYRKCSINIRIYLNQLFGDFT